MSDGLRWAIGAYTFDPERGGIAVVAGLLERVLRQRAATVRAIALSHDNRPVAGRGAQLNFSSSVVSLQLTGRVDRLLFDHLGYARSQRLVPAPFRKPYAIFLHGIEAWQPLTGSRRAAVCGAGALLANSNFTREKFLSINPLGDPQLCHLPWVGGAVSGAVDSELVASIGPSTAVMIGRTASDCLYKGFDRLNALWPLVVSRRPGAELVIIGGGDHLDRLHAAAPSGVRYVGHVSEATKRAILERAAYFLLPSTDEGFGLVYLEAMAAGLACMALERTAPAEIIVDGTTGWLVRDDDHELVSAIVAAFDDPRRAQFGEQGRERVMSEFTFARFEQSVNRALDRLSEGRR